MRQRQVYPQVIEKKKGKKRGLSGSSLYSMAGLGRNVSSGYRLTNKSSTAALSRRNH